MAGGTAGDLCFLRPDQWRLASEPAMANTVNNAIAQGRRVRAIYPAQALQEAPRTLIGRAAIGEQIRLLLAQLASGAKDEHIARTLGLSLRTVRRRIAALMSDLGVDTRFQAGAEAVRRGWL